MAKLEKHGARKPIIDKTGGMWTGNGYDPDGREETYELTISERSVSKGANYTASLSRQEMLDAVVAWMRSYASNYALEKKKAVRDAT